MITITQDNYILELKKRNIDALNFIIDKYSNLAFKVAYSVLNRRELSEECINDVFMKVWNNIDKFNFEEEKFKNWICTIAKYTAIDILRREKKHDSNINIDEINIQEGILVDSKYEKDEELKIIQEEINKMDLIDREILTRRFYNGEKIKEISKVLDMTENAVNLRILRGRKRLSDKLKGGEVNE